MDVPEADAEELTCDVLLAVSQSIKGFKLDGRAKLTTWIFQIAKNRAIDFHRRCRPEEVELSEDSATVGDVKSFAGRNEELLGWLNDELDLLPEADQMLLKWRAVDIPYSDIAKWLGITDGNARTRHNRLKAKLVNAGTRIKPQGIGPL